MSPVTKLARPIATTTMSAVRMIAGRSAVLLWQTVTVAFSRRSSRAAGLPMTLERPITTACLPVMLDPGLLQDLDARVGGRRQEAVVAEREEARR